MVTPGFIFQFRKINMSYYSPRVPLAFAVEGRGPSFRSTSHTAPLIVALPIDYLPKMSPHPSDYVRTEIAKIKEMFQKNYGYQ